jgi:hypothetical protein
MYTLREKTPDEGQKVYVALCTGGLYKMTYRNGLFWSIGEKGEPISFEPYKVLRWKEII